eukprot:TRINITY_DN1811_c0_g1_i1.p1 TRINITY_DN1811_c0_g1~~TRINITY_DN1811_c0_g1_i1.p1  ORF type:complete len:433 (-),score=93.52 TRINITY_DN1811_c0_g1_i1:55-1353(-)
MFEGAASLKISVEPHVIACVAKQLVRNLPETLLTNQLFDRFIRVQSAEELQVLIHYLPPKYKEILQRLSEVMALVCNNEESTKMDCKNLAVVVGPNLMKKNGDIEFADTLNLFLLLIEKYDEIFDEPETELIDRYPSILEILQADDDDSKGNHYPNEFSLHRRDSDCSISSISTASLSVCSVPPNFGTMSSHYSLSTYSRRASSAFDERELDTARTRIAELEDEISALEMRYREQQKSINSMKKGSALAKAHVLTVQSSISPELGKQHSESFQAERIARVNAESELDEYKKKLKDTQQKLSEFNAQMRLERPSSLPRIPSTSRQDSLVLDFHAGEESSVSELSIDAISRGSGTPTSPGMPPLDRAQSAELETLIKRLQGQFNEMQKRAAKSEATTSIIEARLAEAIQQLEKSEKESNGALQKLHHNKRQLQA